MKTITVKLTNGSEVVVKQLPLRRYSELLKAVQELPKTLGGVENLTNSQVFEKLPLLLANSFPDLMAILTIATDVKKETIEADDFGLKDGVALVTAVIEVNDYRELFDQIKKVMARPTTAALPTPTK